MKMVALAFSGGLDTSFCAVYLKEQLGYEVVSVTVDTGGFSKEELGRIEARARELGVREHYTVDAKSFVYERFISYIIKGNSLRGNAYPLSVGAERVAQAAEVARIAVREKTDAVAHGSTGAGNDQVRFDVAFGVLAPGLRILTPVRELGWSRGKETEWLRSHGVPVNVETRDYSINEGLWGTTIGGKETHNSWDFPPEKVFTKTKGIDETREMPAEIVIDFDRGLPVALDEKRADGVSIIASLNGKAGAYGIGRGIHIGDTILGIKGRIVFEAPAPLILISAHRELEKLVLTKNQRFWKDHLAQVYGDMLHEGLYFDPVMRDIESMIDSSQRRVTGSARVRLARGNFMVAGVKSEHSLMKPDLATYGEVQSLWDSRDAEGFSRIYGVPSKLASIAGKENWFTR
jgi:argininosuccinate synthase